MGSRAARLKKDTNGRASSTMLDTPPAASSNPLFAFAAAIAKLVGCEASSSHRAMMRIRRLNQQPRPQHTTLFAIGLTGLRGGASTPTSSGPSE